LDGGHPHILASQVEYEGWGRRGASDSLLHFLISQQLESKLSMEDAWKPRF
jgi:hypothetical protein